MNSPTLGIFGGSFDPIHLGHLHSLWEITQQLPLDVVHIIPCAQSPHKPAPQASAHQRLTMLKYAIAGQPRWKIDDQEIVRGKTSYTIDTLESLHAQFPKHHLCLIVGADVAAKLTQWHRWQSLLSFAHLIVMTRPNYKLPETPWMLELQRRTLTDPMQLRLEKSAGVYWQSSTQLDISATQIRQLCSQNKVPPFLVPTKVGKYIQEQQLYRIEKNDRS